MLQVGALAKNRLSSLKTVCAVLPPERRVAAIPEKMTASVMRLFCRTASRRRLMTNVVAVSPGKSRKKRHPRFVSTLSIILLYAAFWSSTRLGSFSATNSATSSDGVVGFSNNLN